MEIDPTTIQTAVASRLPSQARWFLDGATLDFDFSPARDHLRALPDGATPIDQNDPALGLLVFALQDFAEGGGAQPWLCVRKNDGWICGFDPDDDDPIFILNSSIARFIETFLFLNQHLGNNEPLPSDCANRLLEMDPEAYSTSNWRMLAEYPPNAQNDES
jgi:hypothetical protein